MHSEGRWTRMVLPCAGVLLALAALPHVWMTLLALIDLGRESPAGTAMLDYETYGWARYSFLMAHLWLLWGVRMWRRRELATLGRIVVGVMALEIAFVWTVIVGLRLRGWPLSLW
jgi:hypothetical protein